MTEHKDTYDHEKVTDLIGRITDAAKETGANLLEFDQALRSLQASVASLLDTRINSGHREL